MRQQAEFRRDPLIAVVTAFLGLFAVVGVALYGLPRFYPFFVQDLGWTRQQVTSGNAYSKIAVALAFGFIAGRMVDRLGPRRLMIAGILMAGAALIGLSYVDSLGVFYLFPAVYGVLGRLYAPDLYLSGRTDTVVLVLPERVVGGLGGELLGALVAAGAFAAFMSTASGLLFGLAPALAGTRFRAPQGRRAPSSARKRVRGRWGRAHPAALPVSRCSWIISAWRTSICWTGCRSDRPLRRSNSLRYRWKVRWVTSMSPAASAMRPPASKKASFSLRNCSSMPRVSA